MQQRQLRLGDILDDYCPRERRVTNHAIVAMVDQDVKQTRCTTCDAEHEYKQAKVPPQRKKKPAAGALYQEVLAGIPRKPAPTSASPDSEEVAGDADVESQEPEPDVPEPLVTTPERDEVEGPVHRPLIRAQLPRPAGEVPVRPAPEFTIRQPMARPGARFRPGGGAGGGGQRRGGAGQGQGQGAGYAGQGGAPFRFGGRRGSGPAPAGQPGQGNRARPSQSERQGQPHRRRGGKKRSK